MIDKLILAAGSHRAGFLVTAMHFQGARGGASPARLGEKPSGMNPRSTLRYPSGGKATTSGLRAMVSGLPAPSLTVTFSRRSRPRAFTVVPCARCARRWRKTACSLPAPRAPKGPAFARVCVAAPSWRQRPCRAGRARTPARYWPRKPCSSSTAPKPWPTRRCGWPTWPRDWE